MRKYFNYLKTLLVDCTWWSQRLNSVYQSCSPWEETVSHSGWIFSNISCQMVEDQNIHELDWVHEQLYWFELCLLMSYFKFKIILSLWKIFFPQYWGFHSFVFCHRFHKGKKKLDDFHHTITAKCFCQRCYSWVAIPGGDAAHHNALDGEPVRNKFTRFSVFNDHESRCSTEMWKTD